MRTETLEESSFAVVFEYEGGWRNWRTFRDRKHYLEEIRNQKNDCYGMRRIEGGYGVSDEMAKSLCHERIENFLEMYLWGDRLAP